MWALAGILYEFPAEASDKSYVQFGSVPHGVFPEHFGYQITGVSSPGADTGSVHM